MCPSLDKYSNGRFDRNVFSSAIEFQFLKYVQEEFKAGVSNSKHQLCCLKNNVDRDKREETRVVNFFLKRKVAEKIL